MEKIEGMLRLLGLGRRATSISSSLIGSSCRGSTFEIVIRRGFCLGVIPDGVDRNSEAFASNSNSMADLISELQSHVAKVSLSLSLPLFVSYRLIRVLD